MNGFETLKNIKQIRPETNFIVISGHCDKEEYDQMIEAGAMDFLVKPINIESLVEKINDISSDKE